MNKEELDYIEKELNKDNFFNIVDCGEDSNELKLVWKIDGSLFAVVYKDKIKELIKNIKEENKDE